MSLEYLFKQPTAASTFGSSASFSAFPSNVCSFGEPLSSPAFCCDIWYFIFISSVAFCAPLGCACPNPEATGMISSRTRWSSFWSVTLTVKGVPGTTPFTSTFDSGSRRISSSENEEKCLISYPHRSAPPMMKSVFSGASFMNVFTTSKSIVVDVKPHHVTVIPFA